MVSMLVLTAIKKWAEEKKRSHEEIGCFSLILVMLFVLALVFGICCLCWWIGMLLWNGCLVAAVPVLTKVSFWQFAGIEILSGMLFKNSSNSSSSKD